MKKIIFISTAVLSALLFSCDKVDNAYPKTGGGTGELDWTLYPDGDSAHYAQNHWPVWTDNTNTLTNVLIEDFTGHRCFNCPNAATLAHNLMNANPGRVFVAGIHSSAVGMSAFQEVNAEYPTVLYNDIAFEIGTYFGSQPGTSFIGNPHGAISRLLTGTDNTSAPGTWTSKTSTVLNSTLKVNLQAEHNYFASTRGLFLHTEVDVIDAGLTNPLGLVVYVLEDSIVGPQLMPDLSTNDTYVHRDVLRACIDNKAFGRTLDADDLGSNGKYYVDYSYKLPSEYEAENMHLLIYVYDKNTGEIYQVIEEEIE